MRTMFGYLLLISTLIVSCAPVVRVNSFDNEYRRPTTGKIDVFTSSQNIPYEYREIGLITIDDEGWGRSESELLNAATQKARDMGANGLIILDQDKQLDGYLYYGGVPVAVNRRVVRATAIIITGYKEQRVEAQSGSSTVNSVVDELVKLKQLLDEGAITQEEYDRLKLKLLNE